MAVHPDNRLLDAPMTPVACGTCSAVVETRKSSWDQTTLQWHADAMKACLERRASSGRAGAAFHGCSSLGRSVREAAVRGELEVLSGEPLPVNTEALNSIPGH